MFDLESKKHQGWKRPLSSCSLAAFKIKKNGTIKKCHFKTRAKKLFFSCFLYDLGRQEQERNCNPKSSHKMMVTGEPAEVPVERLEDAPVLSPGPMPCIQGLHLKRAAGQTHCYQNSLLQQLKVMEDWLLFGWSCKKYSAFGVTFLDPARKNQPKSPLLLCLFCRGT